MTQLGLGFGQLMQQGIGSGMNAYRADQQLAMARIAQQAAMEQDALRVEMMREDLARRRRDAERLLVQDEADRNVLGAMFSAQPPTVNPDGTVTDPDWTTGIDARVMSAASPRVQDMLYRHKTDRLALPKKRAELTNEYNAAKASGALSLIAPERWDEYINMGIAGLDIEKAPESIRGRAINRQENQKQAMVDLMTIPETDGTMGPPAVNEAQRAWLSSLPAEAVELVFKQQWLPAEKQRREQMQAEAEIQRETAAMLAVTPSLAPDKARAFVMARRAGLVNQEAVNISGRVPQADITAQREAAKYEAGVAKDAMERAEKAYRDVTGTTSESGAFLSGPLVPPTQAERERLKHPATTRFGDGVADMSDDDYGALKAKVSAWDAYEKAAADFAAASRAAVRAMTPPQARPVPPQSAPAQVPTASPATPAMEATSGQVNRKPPADLFREAVSELQDERGGFDVVSLVRRMRDAGVDPETVKALMAEHGVGVVGGTP